MLLKQPNHKPLKLVTAQISITSYSLVPTLPTWKEREKEGREERGIVGFFYQIPRLNKLETKYHTMILKLSTFFQNTAQQSI